MWSIFILGASIGLLGGFHCVAMCGPIAAFIHNKSSIKSIFLLYNSGRVITYVIMGVALGLVGSGLEIFGMQQWLSIIAGVVLIALIVLPAMHLKLFKGTHLFTPIHRMKIQISKAVSDGNVFSYLILGMLNGLLPCGLVYVALASSLASANISSSAMLMLGFGFGTWPLMSLIAFGAKYLNGSKLRLNYIVPTLTIFVGILLITRGLALDIPYISPILAKLGPDYGITNCINP